MKDKIKELLGVGLPANVVASAVGVSDSYVSQLLSEEVFASEVQTLKIANLTEAATRDGKWNTLEDRLLEKIENLLPMMIRPMEVIRALQVVNNATRRAAPREMAATATHQHVHLHLPATISQKFVINPQNQIVEVDGKTIATMSAKDVVKKLEIMEGKRVEGGKEHIADEEEAKVRMRGLKKLAFLPVSELV